MAGIASGGRNRSMAHGRPRKACPGVAQRTLQSACRNVAHPYGFATPSANPSRSATAMTAITIRSWSRSMATRRSQEGGVVVGAGGRMASCAAICCSH